MFTSMHGAKTTHRLLCTWHIDRSWPKNLQTTPLSMQSPWSNLPGWRTSSLISIQSLWNNLTCRLTHLSLHCYCNCRHASYWAARCSGEVPQQNAHTSRFVAAVAGRFHSPAVSTNNTAVSDWIFFREVNKKSTVTTCEWLNSVQDMCAAQEE